MHGTCTQKTIRGQGKKSKQTHANEGTQRVSRPEDSILMSILSKLIYRFNARPIKTWQRFLQAGSKMPLYAYF